LVFGVKRTEETIVAEAIEAGVDIEMVEFNLTLTPEQRAHQHDGALQLVLEIKRAGELVRKFDRGEIKAGAREGFAGGEGVAPDRG
jgi:hypothetical protein